MKRLIAVLASASFVVAIGCSDYDIRLEKTLEEKKYEKRLNDNLDPAPTKGKLQGDDIFVRPPLGLTYLEAFSLIVVESGKFDIEHSFVDAKSGSSLHIVARIKRPKAPPNAKKGATTAETATRGKFLDDVVELVKAAYNVELVPAQLKAESKSHANRTNDYKAWKGVVGMKEVQVYVYTEPNNIHEVALIFEYPNTKEGKDFMDPKINLCLQSFAVSDRAKRSYEGTSELDGGEMVSPGAPPPI